MTPAQTTFLVALAVILVLVTAFAVLVIAGARRSSGGPSGPLRRLARPSIARLEVHRWAFYAHRIGGVAILAFLGLHLVDLGLIAVSPALYDEVHALYGTPVLRLFEVGLFMAILFHATNGLRLLLMDLVDVGARTSERLLWLAIGLTVVLTIPASLVILRPVIG